MSIERVFPTQICFEDGLSVSVSQPDAIKNKSPFGPPVSFRYADRVLRSYAGRFADIAAGSSNFKRLESFFEQVPPNVGQFWLKEALFAEHRNLRCHQRGDASRVAFIAPVCNGGSVDAVFVDDVPVAPADYTVILNANLISSDNDCNGDGDSATVPSSITSPSSDPISVSRTLPDIGYTSYLVEPASAKTNVELKYSTIGTTVPGDYYTIGVSYLAEPGNYDLLIYWEDFAGSPLSTTTNNVVILAAGWIHSTFTELAPAGALSCTIAIKRKHSSGTPMYVGGFQFSNDDTDGLFLPDSAPMVVVFDSAPADHAEVSFSVTGYRMTKCELTQKSMAWKQYDIGHTLPSKFSAIEVRQ